MYASGQITFEDEAKGEDTSDNRYDDTVRPESRKSYWMSAKEWRYSSFF